MDLGNIKILSVYPHQFDDANTASDSLMNVLSQQTAGQFTRLTPNAFIYTSHDDGTNMPCCHMVLSTDGSHFVSGLDSSLIVPPATDDQADNEDNAEPDNENESCEDSSCGADESLNSSVDDAEDDTEIGKTDVESQPSVPVGVGIVIVPSDRLSGDVMPTTLTTPQNVMVDESKCDDDKDARCKDDSMDESCKNKQPVFESVSSEIEHVMENLEEASKLVENAITKKYGGTVVRHDGTTFTHVRPSGVIDKVVTKPKTHTVYSHRISN